MKPPTGPLDVRFRALGDPVRRAILQRLARGEATVTELSLPHGLGLPAISKHIRVLEQAHMVKRWRDGRVHRCRLAPKAFDGPQDWLSQTRLDWERMLDRLEALGTRKKEE